MGACFWRSSKLSRESGLGSDGTLSTGALAVVSAAGSKAALDSGEPEAAEVVGACAFDTLAVCATSAKGTASGSTRKPPDGWYRSRKSTFAEFAPTPPLTRRKLIWRPLAVEISKLLSACSLVRACLLYTSDAADDLTRVDLGGRRIIK